MSSGGERAAASGAEGEPRYPYVHVDVEADRADEVSAELFDLGAQGVEERDGTTLIKGKAGAVTLVASFATRDEADEAVATLKVQSPELGARVEEVVGDGWRDEWKKHFKPFDLCEGIVVRPPWEPYEDRRGWQILELEPGRAFGTGLHETTSLVSEALRLHKASLAGVEVLDVGCGSGILSLVALLLGAQRARAVDIDPEAAAVTLENAARNGLASRVEADTQSAAELAGTWPVVLANIEARVLVPMAADLTTRVAPRGLLILSGILVPQQADVVQAYGGFSVESAPTKGEWTALVLRKAPGP